jgi:hypothetical protein
MRLQSSRSRYPFALTSLLVAGVLLWPSGAGALDEEFFGLGVGTQLLVINGSGGHEAGVGATVRARFLWVLGWEVSLSEVKSSPTVRGVAPFRTSLLIHAVQTEHFHFYLSPGMAGQNLWDAFNPAGGSTWYRLGGGVEVGLVDGLRIGWELHWTVPGENALARYVDGAHADVLNRYMTQALSADGSPSDLLGLIPLDRLEITIGLRYYFF